MSFLIAAVVLSVCAHVGCYDHRDPSFRPNEQHITFSVSENNEYMRRNGSSYIFDCSVKDYKVVSDNIEWMKDDHPINFYKSVVNYINRGKRNSQLVIRDVSNKDAGVYKCVIVNLIQKRISRTFVITPVEKPFIYVPNDKTDLVVEEGQNAKFKCDVSGNFTTSWGWMHKSKVITASSRKKMFPHRFLKIRKVTMEDAGHYVCSVSNAFGTSEVVYMLKVKKGRPVLYKKPHLKKRYTNLPEIVLNDLELDCSVYGEWPMNVTWYKDGVPMESLGHARYLYMRKKQILRLLKILPEDRGNYTCMFQNKYGSLSHTIEVEPINQAQTAPYFVGKKNKEITHYAQIGQDLNVTVEVVIFFTAHFQLLLHHDVINETSNTTEQDLKILSTPRDIKLIRQETNRNDAYRYRLNFKFHNLTEEDFASYSVMAGNMFGYDVYQFQIANEQDKVLIITTTTVPNVNRQRISSSANKLTDKTTVIIIISLSIGFAVIFAVACILWRRKSKRGFPNNNRFFGKNATVELVHLNIDDNATAKNVGSRRVKYSSSRLSSCQTEKEYISNLFPADPQWEVDFENIEFRGYIGEGAFGRVMLANIHELPETKEQSLAAVKMLKEDATEHELKDLLSEMQVMKSIGKHTNIVNLLGVSTQQGKLSVILEYCRFGNLRNFLKERRPTSAPDPPPVEQLCLFHLTSFCLQVAKGMEYLASQKCVHRDIAARNILVCENHVVKIADFGLARDVQLTDYYRKCTDGRLPVKWMAMEALFDRVYTVQSDIWSFGILAWEVVTLGGSPYPGVPLEHLFDLLKQGYRMEKPVNCIDPMYDLMLKCWREEPQKRPTFTELICDLESMITDLSGIEYLELQPPIIGLHTGESFSSNSQTSCDQTSANSASVFEEADDDATVQRHEQDRLLDDSMSPVT